MKRPGPPARYFWDYLRHASRPLLACRVNSSSSTYPVYVGGNYNTNANYGLFYFNGNNSATNTNANIGSRHLANKKIIAQISPYRSVKILLLGRGSVGHSRTAPRQTRSKSMPKRSGFIYDRMCDKDMIRAAIQEGTRGKRKRWDVKKVLEDVDGYVDKAYEMLVNHAYVPTKPKEKEIFDITCMKNRVIQIVPFYPDGLMHQLCVMAMQDVLMRGMYRWSCASIPGRGNKCAAGYVRRALHNDVRGTKYCLKMDIKRYYPSISPNRLIWALARKIKDKLFLKTVYDIITSGTESGLAIGFYINQWLANFFLEPLDHFIRTLPGVKYYVRNMDDMVLMGPNKKKLHRARKEIEKFLGEKLGLRLKENWQVFPVDARGIDFVGFRFYHTHTTLRRRNFFRFARQCRRVQRMIRLNRGIPFRIAAGLLSRAGQLKHCDSVDIRERYFDPIGAKRLKAVVRAHAKKMQQGGTIANVKPATD